MNPVGHVITDRFSGKVLSTTMYESSENSSARSAVGQTVLSTTFAGLNFYQRQIFILKYDDRVVAPTFLPFSQSATRRKEGLRSSGILLLFSRDEARSCTTVERAPLFHSASKSNQILC